MSTYSDSLRLELITNGDQEGLWGDTTNKNLGTLLEQAITGFTVITMADANYTLTTLNGAVDEARNASLYVTGTISTARSVIIPNEKKVYNVVNAIPTTSVSAGAITFTAVSGVYYITVNHTNHGLSAGEHVRFSGATSLGGNVTANILNQRYTVTTVVNSNSYTITIPVITNTSDTNNGGLSTTAVYGYALQVRTATGTAVRVYSGQSQLIATDGSDCFAVGVSQSGQYFSGGLEGPTAQDGDSSNKYATTQFTNRALASYVVTTTNFVGATGVVSSINLADNAVTSDKLAADAILPTSITNSSITTEKIQDGAITLVKLADTAPLASAYCVFNGAKSNLTSVSIAVGNSMSFSSTLMTFTNSTTTVTATLPGHGLLVGGFVYFTGLTGINSVLNGTWQVTAQTTDTFSFVVTTAPSDALQPIQTVIATQTSHGKSVAGTVSFYGMDGNNAKLTGTWPVMATPSTSVFIFTMDVTLSATLQTLYFATVTKSSHGLVAGDCGTFSGITGANTTLNGTTWVVQSAPTANTFIIADRTSIPGTFAGTITFAPIGIYKAFNVSKVKNLSTGRYVVNFAEAFSSSSYVAVATSLGFVTREDSGGRTTSTYNVETYNSSIANADYDYINCVFFE